MFNWFTNTKLISDIINIKNMITTLIKAILALQNDLNLVKSTLDQSGIKVPTVAGQKSYTEEDFKNDL